MADQKMYVPPHRRPASSLEGQPPSTRDSLFEGSILSLRRLHLETPSESGRSRLVESRSVRRGRGQFGASPSTNTLNTQSEGVWSVSDMYSELESQGGESEEDLNTASAQYSISTNLDRLSTVTLAPSVSEYPTRTNTPSSPPSPPTTLTRLRGLTTGLPPKLAPSPVPLVERIGSNHVPPGSFGGLPPKPTSSPLSLIERIGPRYDPPGSYGRSLPVESHNRSEPWSGWQKNLIKKQRQNIKAINDQPGPSRKCTTLPTFTQIATLFDGLGEEVGGMRSGDLAVRAGEGISGVEYAGSYKWIESPDGFPTLAVPAVPDIWDPPKEVGQLVHDGNLLHYEEYPDYTSAQLPPNLSTLEPLFLSLTSPDILYDVDVVTGRNNLRKLWSALRPGDNHHTTPFRIDIVYVDPTPSSQVDIEESKGSRGMVILERHEPANTARERPSPKGYHQSYHEATTRRILDGSDRTPGCNRVIKYQFSGMTMLVKFDVSAFIPNKSNWTEYEAGVTELFDQETDLGQASTIMDGLDFDDPVYNGQAIRIRNTNLTPPSQESCISIKTKHHQDSFDAEYHFPQMYFSQTPKVFYAQHQAGDFRFPILEYDLFSDKVSSRMREERQTTTDKVGGILRWIVSLSREHGRGLGLVWDGKRFSVCGREEGPNLSAPVREMIRDVRTKGLMREEMAMD